LYDRADALGQTGDLGKVKDLMLTPIAGEITEREPYNGHLIFQGGILKVSGSTGSSTIKEFLGMDILRSPLNHCRTRKSNIRRDHSPMSVSEWPERRA